MAAVGQDLPHRFRGRFEMKLEAENAVVIEKGLTAAALALGQMDRASGRCEGIAVPVKDGGPLRQAVQENRTFPLLGQAIGNQPISFSLPAKTGEPRASASSCAPRQMPTADLPASMASRINALSCASHG